MGDRGNIVVQETEGKRVYLYTHWKGSQIGGVVAKALAKKKRWDDAPYLARIIFCELIDVEGDIKGEAGYGISAGICDNEYPILVVDVEKQVVRFEDELGVPEANSNVHSFEAWAAQAEATATAD